MRARISSAKSAAYQGRGVFVIARIESLIADTGKLDAITRASSYAEAGADAVLVHSRTFAQLVEVVDDLDIPVPIIAIPTLYPDVTPQQLLEHNIAGVILANQVLRASVRAIVDTLSQMRNLKTFRDVEDSIVPLSDIERIVGLESFKL